MMRGKGAGAESNVQIMLEPADVQAGTPISVTSYRQIQAARAGATLAPITSGGLGSEIKFTPQVSGTFTRNFVKEGGQLFAEIM